MGVSDEVVATTAKYTTHVLHITAIYRTPKARKNYEVVILTRFQQIQQFLVEGLH